jgi:hypothetical protein
MQLRTITPQDYEWVRDEYVRWYSRDRMQFLCSESLVERSDIRTVSRFDPPGQPVTTIVTEHRPDGTLAMACDCTDFADHQRCRHVAAVVMAYYRYVLAGKA